MTNIESNGPVSVLSNPTDLRRTVIRHLALGKAADDLVRWHPGAFGVMQGYADRAGRRLPPSYQDGLRELHAAGLISNGQPPAVRPSAGNAVRVTPSGTTRFAAWNASVALVGAA